LKTITCFNTANIPLKYYPAPSSPSLSAFCHNTSHSIFSRRICIVGRSWCSTVLARMSAHSVSVAVLRRLLGRWEWRLRFRIVYPRRQGCKLLKNKCKFWWRPMPEQDGQLLPRRNQKWMQLLSDRGYCRQFGLQRVNFRIFAVR
jgi:hypothetical protein